MDTHLFQLLTFFVLPLVAHQLTARVEHVAAAGPDAVYVVELAVVPAVGEPTFVRFEELLEAVAQQLLVLQVVHLVLLHLALVLERKLAAVAQAMEVCRLLVRIRTARLLALLQIADAQKALHPDGARLSVVIRVHLDVARADVDLVTFRLDAMVVRLLAVELAFRGESIQLTVVHAAEPKEAEL